MPIVCSQAECLENPPRPLAQLLWIEHGEHVNTAGSASTCDFHAGKNEHRLELLQLVQYSKVSVESVVVRQNQDVRTTLPSLSENVKNGSAVEEVA